MTNKQKDCKLCKGRGKVLYTDDYKVAPRLVKCVCVNDKQVDDKQKDGEK